MADKRMFNKKITDSDEFITLSASSQALYFHLNMGADDDGFNNQVQMAIFKAHASIDDLKVLLLKNFIIQFDTGVIVIRHWRMNNYLQKDRIKPTIYQNELKNLCLNDSNVYNLDTTCIHSIDKISIDIDKNKKENIKRKKFEKPTIEEIENYCKERNNGINANAFYDFYESKDWYVGKNKMKDWKACIRTWEQRDSKHKQDIPEWFNKEIKDEEMSEDAKRVYKQITGNDYK